MFPLPYNLKKTTSKLCHRNFVEKDRCKQSGFLDHQNYVEKSKVKTPWIFRHRKKHVETTRVFQPSKLHRKKYVETTWIFRSAKLHRKSTWKWPGNSSKFDIRRIDVIPRRIDVDSRRCVLWLVVHYPIGRSGLPSLKLVKIL